MRILPFDPSLTEEEAREQGRIAPSQEWAITRMLEEVDESNGAILADDVGFGKTLIGVEFLIRGDFERVLLIALPDTHLQWATAIMEQSDGTRQLRIMNGSTVEGRANFAAFLAKEPGWYIAGSHYLAEKDWTSVVQRTDAGAVIYKTVKKTGELVLKTRREAAGKRRTSQILLERPVGAIGPAFEPQYEYVFKAAGAYGPALEPTPLTKSVRKEIFSWTYRKPFDVVMFDEVQEIANKQSNKFKTIYSIKARYRMAMSATWFLNAIENQWTIARWTWPDPNPETGERYVDTSHDRWKDRFLIREDVRGKNGKVIEGQFGTVKRTIGERNEGEFVRTLPCYIRREKPEQAPVPIVVRVEPTPEQAAQIAELTEDLLTWVTDWQGVERPLVADLPPVLRARLDQVTVAELSVRDGYGGVITESNTEGVTEEVYFAATAASAKLRAMRGVLESPGWKHKQVGIFINSKIGAHLYAERMRAVGYSVGVWTGDLSRGERQRLKEAFIRGEFQYLLGTIQSMSTGIDGLQTVCNRVLWVNKVAGDPAKNHQAEGRYFRPRRVPDTPEDSFQQAILVMPDTVDEAGFQNLIDKAWRIRAALNGGIAA